MGLQREAYYYWCLLQIVKPRPVQAASIPGMLGMFQIVRVFDP